MGADEPTDPLHVTNIHATFPAYKLWTHCKQEQPGNVKVWKISCHLPTLAVFVLEELTVEQFYALSKIKESLRYAREHLSSRLAGGRSFTPHCPACMPAKITSMPAKITSMPAQIHSVQELGSYLTAGHLPSELWWPQTHSGLVQLVDVSATVRGQPGLQCGWSRRENWFTQTEACIQLRCMCIHIKTRHEFFFLQYIILYQNLGHSSGMMQPYIYARTVHQTPLTLKRASVYHYHAELINRYDDRARSQHCTIMRTYWREPRKYEKQHMKVLHGFLFTSTLLHISSVAVQPTWLEGSNLHFPQVKVLIPKHKHTVPPQKNNNKNNNNNKQ